MEYSDTYEAEDLLHYPWNPVCISNKQLLAKARFGDTAYHVLLTDMNCVWEESMDAVPIQRRAQELNKRLRAPVKAFFSHLRDVAQPCLMGGGQAEGAAQVSLVRQAGRHLDVKLKSELAGLPFYWEFRCTSAPVTMVCSQLVRPLLLMSRLLQGQVEHMGGLLLRKDAEIQDYKENGATLSRERLQTELFDEQSYGENFITQTLPELCSRQPVGFGLAGDLQALYGTVVGHGTRKRKRSEESRGGEPRPPTQQHTEVDRTPSTGVLRQKTLKTPALGESAASAGPPDRGARGQSRDVVNSPGRMPTSTQPQSVPGTGSPSKPKKKKGKGLFQ